MAVNPVVKIPDMEWSTRWHPWEDGTRAKVSMLNMASAKASPPRQPAKGQGGKKGGGKWPYPALEKRSALIYKMYITHRI